MQRITYATCVGATLGAMVLWGGPGCGGQTISIASNDGGTPASSGSSGSNGGGNGSIGSGSGSGGTSSSSGSPSTNPISAGSGSSGGTASSSGTAIAGAQPCPAYGPGPRETCTIGVRCDTAPDCVCASDGRVTCDFARSCRSNADCPAPETCGFNSDIGMCPATGSCGVQQGPACAGASSKACACDGSDTSVCLSDVMPGYTLNYPKALRHLGPCSDSGPHWYPSCPGELGCSASATKPAVDDAGAPCPPIGSPCPTSGQTCGNLFDACSASEVCEITPVCSAVMGAAFIPAR